MFSREFVQYPSVHSTKHDLVPVSSIPEAWHVVQHPQEPHGHHLDTVYRVGQILGLKYHKIQPQINERK